MQGSTPVAPAAADSETDINALAKHLFDLQKLMREAQKAQRPEPTSEPGSEPLEVSSSLLVLCKRAS